jgi:hypothetical protein
MPVCAQGIQQPDGKVLLALDPLATDLTACAYVVETGPEVGNSLLSMTAQDGGIFSAGVIAVWMAGYGIRSVISIIRGSENA